jgi:hypothetical protein
VLSAWPALPESKAPPPKLLLLLQPRVAGLPPKCRCCAAATSLRSRCVSADSLGKESRGGVDEASERSSKGGRGAVG